MGASRESGQRLRIVLYVVFVLAIMQMFDTGSTTWRMRRTIEKHRERIREYSAPRIISALQDMISTMEYIDPPDYLEHYFMYDITAKRALIDLYRYIEENNVPLPLFENKLEGFTQDTLPRKDGPLICISIATARRLTSSISYLIQMISALLNRMNYKKYKNDVYIHVFNVDNEPDEFIDIDLIKPLLPITNIKSKLEPNWGFVPSRLHYEDMDNSLIIQKFHQLGCQYPVFVEDDAVPTTDWVDSIMLAIKQLRDRPKGDDWLLVKFYVAHEVYDDTNFKRGVSEYDMGWNSVANMINPKYMPFVIRELQFTTQISIEHRDQKLLVIKDHVMNRSARLLGLKQLAFEPVIFQHTGIFSSVRDRFIDKESVERWDMSAGRFDAEKKPIEFNRELWD
jgi:hypothetical protein